MYKTKEEILKLGEIDPELKEYLDNNPMPAVEYGDLAAFKDFAEQRNAMIKKILGDSPPDIKTSETTYKNRDGTSLRMKIYAPAEAPSNGSPVVMLIHGGGFCIGSPEGEEQTARNLVQAFHATCFSIQYRLAPEHPFPAAPDDSWDALKWVAENAKHHGGDPSKGFIVGGTSAGGNLSAVLALQARDEGLSPPLTGQYLAIPAVGRGELVPEKYRDRDLGYEQNKNAPVLPQAAIHMFMDGYKPDENDHVKYTVMAHPKGHKDLPAAFFQVDGMDPLRDEGLIYASVLEDAGAKTSVKVYPGLPHGHWGFFPFLKSSALFRKEQIEGFGWLLGQKPEVLKETTQQNPTTL